MSEPVALSPEDQTFVSSLYTEENSNAAITWVIENLGGLTSKPVTSTVVVAYILGHASLRFTAFSQGVASGLQEASQEMQLARLYECLCDCDDCQDHLHVCGETPESAKAAGFDYRKLIQLLLFLLETFANKQ